jgi:ArsR family transcriptional regulator, arsenate/arsenite/antimonite-responsive transcriptional repressor
MDEWRDLKNIYKALADVARLTIVYYLARHEEITVTALAELLGLSQPLVSWHLRKLRRADLITTRRVGRQVYCSLHKSRFEHCSHCLQALVDPHSRLEAIHAEEAVLVEAETGYEDK